jgi:hypothetical protein
MGGGEQIPSLDSAGVALCSYSLCFWELRVRDIESTTYVQLPQQEVTELLELVPNGQSTGDYARDAKAALPPL